ncbi:hypothetical protein RSAG8_02840, partial [Rhizoctonia solani AG-8 WAC10335]
MRISRSTRVIYCLTSSTPQRHSFRNLSPRIAGTSWASTASRSQYMFIPLIWNGRENTVNYGYILGTSHGVRNSSL